LSKKSLELPLGIRLWNRNLLDFHRDFSEGYEFSLIENSSDSYRFTAIVSPQRVADIFDSFADILPEEAFLILEFYQDDQPSSSSDDLTVPNVFYSPYLPTKEILEILRPYWTRIIHDGFVGIGLANNRAGMELFYSEEKIITCFTSNHIRVMNLFAEGGVPHAKSLKFPTDTGHDHLSLLCHERENLPAPFDSMTERELDYSTFCSEISEQLDMYPVEESLSFFLSKKEQDLIEARLNDHPEFMEFAEDDFGSLLLDWNDFVAECEIGFEGDLWEYRQGLKLRDLIQHVIEGIPETFSKKIVDIVADADERFGKNLVDARKRLDPPAETSTMGEHFWYRGVVRNKGAILRRDLIRQGWYKP